jgi:thiol-disulfide isomerase/thioredoxin
MRKILIIFSLLISLQGFAKGGIEFFEGSWAELLHVAKLENKMIFMDAYTSWCGPCKWMSSEIFTQDTVGDFYNENFLCYKLDMEKGEGPEIARMYQISVYPTFMFIDKDGGLVHRFAGGLKEGPFIELGKTALDPDKSLSGMHKVYMSGSASAEEVMDYALALKKAYMPHQQVIDHYFKSIEKSEYSSDGNWKAIKNFIDDIDSEVFVYLVNHQMEFIDKHGQEEVEKKINAVILNYAYKIARKKIKMNYDVFRSKVNAFELDDNGKCLSDCDLLYYRVNKKWSKYIDVALPYMKTFINNDPEEINKIGKNILNHSKDIEHIEEALKYVQYGIQQDDIYMLRDLEAHLYFKLKKYDQAKLSAERAIELAKEGMLNYDTTERLLEKMEKAQ